MIQKEVSLVQFGWPVMKLSLVYHFVIAWFWQNSTILWYIQLQGSCLYFWYFIIRFF